MVIKAEGTLYLQESPGAIALVYVKLSAIAPPNTNLKIGSEVRSL
ncbi:MAG: hypothetical protein QNJ51_28835 [Calothrix sp. MO_167.B12]|nr:hypothetical protein [Calothrix sp. MO_167.B12]